MPIITTASLTAVAMTLGIEGLKAISENMGKNISQAAISWITDLFYQNNKPKKSLKDLQDNPNDEDKLKIVKAIIENSVESSELHLKYFTEIMSNLPKKNNTIKNSNNVNTGKVDTGGGDFRIGDNYGV